MARTFDELNKHPKGSHCNGCPLFNLGASFARTIGSGRNGVALVGEALGESEAFSGQPFQGDAGFQLNAVLERAVLKRDDFLIMNTINCHPPNNYLDGAPYEKAAIAHCSPYFDETLEANPQIKVLVAMGNTALYKILGQKGIKNFHGTVNWSERYGRYVVPTIHPSAVLRGGGKEFPTLLHDIRKATELAKANSFARSLQSYILRPTNGEFEHYVEDYESALREDPTLILASDIETNYSSEIDEEDLLEKDTSYDICRISFSFRSNTAITIPWQADYIRLAMRLLDTRGELWFWNGNKFDVPRLRFAGAPIANAKIVDGMDGWHVLRPDLPRGLAYVSPFFTDLAPWKHLAKSQPEFYSCVDSDSLWRIAMALRAAHQKQGTWGVFQTHWAALEPVLHSMHRIGIGVNDTKRLALRADYEKIRDHTAEEIQKVIPESVKPRAKKKEGGYRGKPKDVRLYIQANKAILTSEDEAWYACDYQRFEYDGVSRWDKILPFNHNSADQIINYLSDRYGPQVVPRHRKTGKPTTGKEDLDRLARRLDDPVLRMIMDAANADGKITAFIDPWTPSADGRVHGIFTNSPSTPRLASQGPNLQNFPIRDEEAIEMRKMIVPGDNFRYLVEADYTGIEAIMVGWYAHDPDYMRLAYKGVHSFLAAKKLKIPVELSWSDADLGLALKEAKKLAKKTLVVGSNAEMYDSCKRTVHGSNYLEGASLLHKTFPELFPTEKAAQADQDFYFDLFPKIVDWQESVINSCYETCYVENAWKIRRWLFGTKRWQYFARYKKWLLVPYRDQVTKRWIGYAEDAKKAVATIPQGSAGMIMRGALLSSAAAELIDRGCLMLTIHDSLVARARDKAEREWVALKLREAMCYNIDCMGGIVIPVEIKTSRENGNWGEMEEMK